MSDRASDGPPPAALAVVAALGRGIRGLGHRYMLRVAYVGALLRAVTTAPAGARRVGLRIFARQVRQTSVESLGLVCLIAFCAGAAVLIEAQIASSQLGLVDGIGRILAAVLIKQLAPLLTAVLVAARAGTGVAAELATAAAFGETESLEAVGVEPVAFYAVPRVAAMGLSMLLLTVYFEATAVAGGAAVTVLRGKMTLSSYLEALRSALRPLDLLALGPKALVLGVVVGLVCSFEGLFGSGAVADVPHALRRSVVGSLSFALVAWAIMSLMTSGVV